LEIRQLSTFTRVGATNLTIGLSPAPGSIDYGINGASPRPRARSLWCRPAGLSALCRIAASAPTIEEPPDSDEPDRDVAVTVIGLVLYVAVTAGAVILVAA
jgi:hypothetical protein